LDNIFPNLVALSKKENSLNTKTKFTYKIPTTSGQKLTNYKHLASNKTKNQTEGSSGLCKHCALCVVVMVNGIICGPVCFTNPGKYKNFLAEPKRSMCKQWYLCGDCLFCMPSTICWPSSKEIFHEMISAAKYNTWNKQDNADGSDQMALSRHYPWHRKQTTYMRTLRCFFGKKNSFDSLDL